MDDHGLDEGQDVREERIVGAHGAGHRQDRGEIEGVRGPEPGADLPTTPLDDRPGDDAVVGLRCVFQVVAFGAGSDAGGAIGGASSEVPSGPLDETFFSWSLCMAGTT